MPGRDKVSIQTLRHLKRQGRRFSMLTCYDFTTAQLLEEAGMESVLVGDTYAEVCLGHPTTLPARMDLMIAVTEAVRRGAPSAYLVGDMPFLSYQVSPEDGIRNAGRFLVEAGCDCVKVEVDHRHLGTVEAMSAASIPVMAHLGLKPQSIHRIGGYRAQGTTAPSAQRILDDARRMEAAGAIAILLEAVPQEVARMITEAADVPVVGCVSGPYCDGQVVVLHDILGLGAGHPPGSVRQYAQLREPMLQAFRAYRTDVESGDFPIADRSVSMPRDELADLEDPTSGNRPAPIRADH